MTAELKGNKNKICEAIRKFRLMKHMTAKELSKRTGIAAPNISAIEGGERVPKLDMCKKIAKALEADPVEICGIELTEQDEKRLLMKLLAKYALSVELSTVGEENGEPVYDPKGRSIAVLPTDFADFAYRYQKNKSKVEFAIESMSEDDPRYELVKANAEDEFNYWMDMYPKYDAVTNAKERALEGSYPHVNDPKIKKAYSQGIVDYDLINTWGTIVDENMSPEFLLFQSEYIIPNRNESWRAKHVK